MKNTFELEIECSESSGSLSRPVVTPFLLASKETSKQESLSCYEGNRPGPPLSCRTMGTYATF